MFSNVSVFYMIWKNPGDSWKNVEVDFMIRER